MFTKLWFKRVAERAVFTFSQVVLAGAGVDQFDWLTLDWGNIFKLAGIAAGLSILTSIGKSGVGDPEDPSLVK